MKHLCDAAGLWLAGTPRWGGAAPAGEPPVEPPPVEPPANLPPVTAPDAVTVFAATPTIVDVLANDIDPEGGPLSLVSATATLGTVVVLPEGTLLYTPPPGFTGSDAVVYVAADALGAETEGTLSVTVAGPMLALTPNADGTLTVVAASGEISVTVTSPAEFAGTYVTDTALLESGPVALAPPAILGEPETGAALVAQTGLWIFEGEVTGETWGWRRDGSPIPGAVSSTYQVDEADAGAALVAVQTLAASGGSRSAESAPVAVASPFAPDNDAGLIAWYDASDAATVAANGSTVTSWANKAGAGSLAGVAGPTTGIRTIAGRNAIDFAGMARMTGPLALPASGDVAFHMALAIDSVVSAFAAVISTNAARDFQLDAGGATAFDGRLNVRSIGDTLFLQGGPYSGILVVSLVFDRTGTGTSQVIVNGNPAGTGAYTTALDQAASLGIMTNRNQNAYVDGAVGEVIVTGTLAETAGYHAYLAQKWGSA